MEDIFEEVMMKKQDVSYTYNIPLSTLDYYESFNQLKMGEYDEGDIEKLSLIISLQNLNFGQEEISDFMQLNELGERTKAQRIKVLKRKRQQLLDDIHHQQKTLDILDCLLYQMNDCCHGKGSII